MTTITVPIAEKCLERLNELASHAGQFAGAIFWVASTCR
jgi:hypothetical protein